MTITRRLEPEWLDELPSDDPRAMRSRRDIKRLNALMRHGGIMARALLRRDGTYIPRTIVDLGAGDGTFSLRLAQRLARRWPNSTIILQDRQDIVAQQTIESFSALGWKAQTATSDVFDFLERAPAAGFDVITANLFLHHFPQEQLAVLLKKAAKLARVFIACEPRRARLTVRISRALWVIGCNDVSVHDAVVSARAGFAGQELSSLWPHQGQWDVHEWSAALFSHCFLAKRAAQPT
jgi:hypothetical protein